MSSLPRRIRRWSWLVALVGLLGSGMGCKSHEIPTSRPRVDAAARAASPDAGAVVGPGRPGAVREVLRFVPARDRWFVALGPVGPLTRGLRRLWGLLTVVPDLGPSLVRIAGSLARAVGAWPPAPASWSRLGVDPAGGLVLARVEPATGLSGGLLLVASSSRPRHLLRRLVSAPAGQRLPRARPLAAALEGIEGWWCARARRVVVCGSDAELVKASLTLPAARLDETLAGQLDREVLQNAELLGGWRSGPKNARSVVAARFPGWGVELRARFRSGPPAEWAGWLASPRAPDAGAVAAPGAATVVLDRDRIASLVGMLPRGSVPLAKLIGQCTGRMRLVVEADGWSVVADRKAARAAFTKPREYEHGDLTFWVLAPQRRLVIADTAARARAALTPPAPATLPGPLARRLKDRASAWLRLPVVDPLELLGAAGRLRLVAAQAGLPVGERAFVALARALLSLGGEAAVTVEKTRTGARVRATLLSPAGGSDAARKTFTQLWKSKWQGDGFYDRAGLRRVSARHPDAGVGRLGRGLAGLRLGAPWRAWLRERLLAGLAWLRGPVVDCAVLAARLTRCREAFGRGVSPARWRELNSLALPDHRRTLRAQLLTRAGRDARALGAHCDRLAGRLENVEAVTRCLAASSCAAFASCLVRAFKPR